LIINLNINYLMEISIIIKLM